VSRQWKKLSEDKKEAYNLKAEEVITPQRVSLLRLVSSLMKILLSLIRSHQSSLSKSFYSHIRELRCIRPYIDSKTASTIAASIVHSKLDYCNSLYYTIFLSLK